MIATRRERQHEEEPRQQRVPRLPAPREAHHEEHHQRQPLRPQRRQVRHLVGAYRREGEQRPPEERRPLPRPQLPRQPVGGERREEERQQPHDVVEQHRVVGEQRQRQHQDRRPADRLVQPQRVPQRVEDVPVGQRARVGLERVDRPAHLPREEGGVPRVHHPQVGRKGPREDDGQDRVQPERTEGPHREATVASADARANARRTRPRPSRRSAAPRRGPRERECSPRCALRQEEATSASGHRSRRRP